MPITAIAMQFKAPILMMTTRTNGGVGIHKECFRCQSTPIHQNQRYCPMMDAAVGHSLLNFRLYAEKHSVD
jgi:hypothetical protein